MKVIKSFFIAVSIYSKIPVPQFAWEDEDIKYVFIFFPWIGLFIGICIYFWNQFCSSFQIGTLCRVAISAVIPLMITGGFHMDGFMDTMDAIHSYCPRERKLEILKDSHIGAFAVIMMIRYGLVFLGMFSEIREEALLKMVCSGFFLSRCLCGISAVSFPLAKKEGTLCHFANHSHKSVVKGVLYIQSMICIGFLCRWSFWAGLIVAATAVAALILYFFQSRKAFGGITGDTAGYFILFCENCIVAAVAFIDIFIRRLG